jgi:hypothetical protein
VYVDLRALRNDRVSLVERGSPHSLCLLEVMLLVVLSDPVVRRERRARSRRACTWTCARCATTACRWWREAAPTPCVCWSPASCCPGSRSSSPTPTPRVSVATPTSARSVRTLNFKLSAVLKLSLKAVYFAYIHAIISFGISLYGTSIKNLDAILKLQSNKNNSKSKTVNLSKRTFFCTKNNDFIWSACL